MVLTDRGSGTGTGADLGNINRKVHTSSLAFVPEFRSMPWQAIQALRHKHDRKVQRWSPHINLLYPFVPSDEFDACAPALAAALAKMPNFSITLDKISYFKHGSSCTAWLSLDDESCRRLTDLQALVEAVFPHCDDLARRASADAPSAFKPHLTVGQFKNETQVKKFIKQQSWSPITIEVSELSMLACDSQTTPFVPLRKVSLTHHNVEVVRNTIAEAKTQQLDERDFNCYQCDGDQLRLRFELPTAMVTDQTTTSKEKTGIDQMLFVVDNSSSMNGHYDSVKTAVRYMLDQSAQSESCADPAFVLYNTTAKACSGQDILRSQPRGCTSFEKAFDVIMDYISRQPPSASVSVVFMTDGDDTASSHLREKQQLFKSYLHNCRRRVVVHTLGFGRGHKREFLQELATMGNAPEDGVYRYAEGSGCGSGSGSSDLDLSVVFEDMFDLLATNVKMTVTVGAKTVEVDASKSDDGEKLCFDVMLKNNDCEDGSQSVLSATNADSNSGSGSGSLTVLVNGRGVRLPRAALDAAFAIRSVEELEIVTQKDLDAAQRLLSGVNPFRCPRVERVSVADMRATAQEKLDKFHSLFAKIARGLVRSAGDEASVAAQLSSLQHETRFAKSRRFRTMDKRAAANADSALAQEVRLKGLRAALDMRTFAVEPLGGASEGASAGVGQGQGLGLACCLSGDTIVEMMEDSADDIMVFGLRVRRPEQVIDAPTQVAVNGVCCGTYSNLAFTASTKFACSARGRGSVAQALGGFVAPSTQTIFHCHPDRADENSNSNSNSNSSSSSDGTGAADDADAVGLFRGIDGQWMNGCLPLYLNEQHWRRVEVQLESVLGFFFTLDPLGFQEAQYMALFMILGEMLAMRARTKKAKAEGMVSPRQYKHQQFDSEWADWLIRDFTKLCTAVLPKARRHLHFLFQKVGGGEAATATGKGKIDLIDEFVRGPKGRAKGVLPNLMVLIGWKAAREHEEQGGQGHATDIDAMAFEVAFAEELWRRNIGRYYKQHPTECVNELLDQLLYGPDQNNATRTNAGAEAGAEAGTSVAKFNSRKMEKRFAAFAQFKWGDLSKAKMAQARAVFGLNGENPPGKGKGKAEAEAEATQEDDSGISYQPRRLVAYHEHEAFLEQLAQQELSKIRGMNLYVSPLFEDRILGRPGDGDRFGGALRRAMVVQALQYHHKAAMKHGVSSGEYKNTYSFCCAQASSAADTVSTPTAAPTAAPTTAVGAEPNLSALLEHAHAAFERKRREGWAEAASAKADLRVARRIVASRDPLAFAGRLMAACPTRGGNVFRFLVVLLTGGADSDTHIPLVELKVRALLTGKISLEAGAPEKVVMARGESWVTATADTVERLCRAVGEEAFVEIENSMRGTWGWVYRESDIPNRHSHCNSNPNPQLGGSFRGFRRNGTNGR